MTPIATSLIDAVIVFMHQGHCASALTFRLTNRRQPVLSSYHLLLLLLRLCDMLDLQCASIYVFYLCTWLPMCSFICIVLLLLAGTTTAS